MGGLLPRGRAEGYFSLVTIHHKSPRLLALIRCISEQEDQNLVCFDVL